MALLLAADNYVCLSEPSDKS